MKKNTFPHVILIALVSLLYALTATGQTYTLSEALNTARLNNTELQKRRLDVESMRELKAELFTKYFPQVEASANYFYRDRGLLEGTDMLDVILALLDSEFEDMPNNAQILKHGTFGGISVVQPIYAGGRITTSNRLAELGIEAQKEVAAIKQDELEQEVEKYFWQLVQLYEADHSLMTMDTLVSRASHDAELALRAGLVTANDKMQVDIYASQLESTRLQLSNGMLLCRDYLAYLIGVERVDSVLYNDIYQVKAPLSYYADPNASLLSRHESQLLDMQVRVFQLSRKYKLGEYLPTIGVGINFNYHYIFADRDNGVYHRDIDKKNFGWMALARVSRPISAWWGGKHALRRSDLAIHRAEMDRYDKRRLMSVQIQQRWNTLNEKYKQIALAHQQLTQASENQRQQSSAYRSGSITMTERLQADALYEKSRTNYIDACIKYRIALTEYLHATGRSIDN